MIVVYFCNVSSRLRHDDFEFWLTIQPDLDGRHVAKELAVLDLCGLFQQELRRGDLATLACKKVCFFLVYFYLACFFWFVFGRCLGGSSILDAIDLL